MLASASQAPAGGSARRPSAPTIRAGTVPTPGGYLPPRHRKPTPRPVAGGRARPLDPGCPGPDPDHPHGGRAGRPPGSCFHRGSSYCPPRGSSEARGARAQRHGPPGHRSLVQRGRASGRPSLSFPPPRPAGIVARVRIGFVGAGLMGSGMVRNLAAAGHDVALYARTPRAPGPARAPAPSVAEALIGADLGCSCVTDSDDVREVVEAMLAAPSPPPVLVELSTIAPAVARELAEECAGHGVAYLDCPVSGGPAGRGRRDALDHVRGRRRGPRARGSRPRRHGRSGEAVPLRPRGPRARGQAREQPARGGSSPPAPPKRWEWASARASTRRSPGRS